MDTVLATNNFGDTRSGGLAGPMGLFLILLLAAATVLLIRNMNVRLRRLPERFDDQRPEDETPSAASDVLDLTERGGRPGSPL
ncbi:hypothetical protein O7632_07005 [Solwaraspora sp. WMMD406]|uniref:hypothetical protein n=1 Tax=Solwaraspora sp. WMMD406 TaxID=3016095 RepID=UPI002416FCC1|nr:hypothetical protein [Solwaraspora sp. WMMD406]MDG4763856.1 hypothetical protein [Solwaraspora sp. WMMD406]